MVKAHVLNKIETIYFFYWLFKFAELCHCEMVQLFFYLSSTPAQIGSPDRSWGLLRLAYVLSHTDSTDSTDF